MDGLQQHLPRLGVLVVGHWKRPNPPLPAEPRVHAVGRVVPVPANGSVARISISLTLSRMVKQLLAAEQFDVLHLHEPLMPALPLTVLRLGPEQFAWQFVPMVAGIFFGALASNRLAGRIALARHVAIGFAFMVGGGAANVLYHLALPPMLPWSVLPMMFYAFGMSVAAPMVTLLVPSRST